MDNNNYEEENEVVAEDETEDLPEPAPETAKTADPASTTEIIGVRFKKNGKTYYFAPAGFTVSEDDRVIVDTSRGQEYGYVAVPNKVIKSSDVELPLRSVVRMATPEDTAIHDENVKKEIDAFNTCIALIDEHKLQMKLIDVEYAFDRSKLLFYFSSEDRVDFRELVRDLAGAFRTRIEMRQIGIRDEAKMLGGLGICGRPFCCSSFLSDFVQVSVKMAKEQNLSINSAKISGACGRLMCCLRYEYDTYLSEKALTPKVDTKVMTPDGPGVVTEANPLAGIVKVRLDSKPEDASQVLYVREDVVKIENYNGEELKKTAIPERGRKNEEEKNLFGDVKVIESPEAVGSGENPPKDSMRDRNPKKPENETPAENPSENRRPHGERHNGKNKGGKFERRRESERMEKPEQKNTETPEQNKAPRKNEKPGNPAENGQNENKKKFRPYYKNFKKKKGNGQSGGGGNPQ